MPGGDYIVIKFARWAFEKFKGSKDKLGTQMRAVGEVMSIGKTYKEAFQKAIRSLEIGRVRSGLCTRACMKRSLEELLGMLEYPTSKRQFVMYEALRKGATVDRAVRAHHDQAILYPADEGAGGGGRSPHCAARAEKFRPPTA